MKPPFQISKLDYWVYGFSLGLCFLLFKQSDLTHTNSSSFAYLYGHFWDFYDYNKPRMGGNDYLPIFYWFFAIWNIPLKLLGLIPEVSSETWMLASPIQTIWSKLLTTIFFFASVRLVGKIAKQIDPSSNAKPINPTRLAPHHLFATSPIAIFAVFIFSGYDIFGVFFSLLGLHAYFTKQWRWFVWWFSVAISFKYFAAFIYLPLVLIIEKRLLYLLAYGLLGILITVLQFALYWHSDVFIGEIFGLLTAKTAGNGIELRLIIANGAYLVMCAYLYFSKLDITAHTEKWHQRAIFACVLSYALLFSWILWHPQWILLITPFICLSYLFIKNQRLMLIIEILGYLGFAVYCMNNWVGNVDNTMVYGGVFGNLLPQSHVLASDIIGRKWMALSRVLFYASLYAPLLLVCFQYGSRKMRKSHNQLPDINLDQQSGRGLEKMLFNLRFILSAYFYIGVTLLCFYRG